MTFERIFDDWDKQKIFEEIATLVERTPIQLLEVFERITNKNPTGKDFLIVGKLWYLNKLPQVIGLFEKK